VEIPLVNSLSSPPQPLLVQCHASDSFQSWLAHASGTLAITTYQSGKVALISSDGQTINVLLRQFLKPMGLAQQGARLALATQHEIWLFANAPQLAPSYLEQQPGQYDALYLPRVAYFTGDLNIHDLAFGDDGLWVVNTRFSCLASLSADFNFVPRWQPHFISELAPEDRCHLNGLVMIGGRPKFVTALGETNEVGGWRPAKATGGILMDVDANEVVLRGLSMPHSPYWHDEQLWLLNSGAGELWRVNPQTGEHDVVCALPGFLRGLYCVGNHALIGLCQIRERHIFGGLPVQERFQKLLCGVALVNLTTGALVGLLEFTNGCQELYDVEFLSNIHRPTILNVEKPAVRQAFVAPDLAYWLRPSSEIHLNQ
jgi:uncharacterized protein (TIGR03032 family)